MNKYYISIQYLRHRIYKIRLFHPTLAVIFYIYTYFCWFFNLYTVCVNCEENDLWPTVSLLAFFGFEINVLVIQGFRQLSISISVGLERQGKRSNTPAEAQSRGPVIVIISPKSPMLTAYVWSALGWEHPQSYTVRAWFI